MYRVRQRVQAPERGYCSAALRSAGRPLCSRHDLNSFASRCTRACPGGLAAAGVVLRRLAGAGAVDADLHRLHAGLYARRAPRARKHRAFQRLAMAVVAVLLDRRRHLRHRELAARRADAGHAPWRLRLIDPQVSWRALWIRYAVGSLSLALGGLGFWWAWLDRDRLTWHDRASKTRLERIARKLQ